MTRVVVLATGGTIGSRFSAEHGAVIAGVGGDELVRNLGHFSPTVDVVTEQFCNVGSFLFTLEPAFGIVKRAEQLLQMPMSPEWWLPAAPTRWRRSCTWPI